MKTAISVPDETSAEVEERARALGMTRSEFYARAARYYLERLEAESLTGQIDVAIAHIGADVDESGRLAAAAGQRRLARDEGDW